MSLHDQMAAQSVGLQYYVHGRSASYVDGPDGTPSTVTIILLLAGAQIADAETGAALQTNSGRALVRASDVADPKLGGWFTIGADDWVIESTNYRAQTLDWECVVHRTERVAVNRRRLARA